MIELEVVPLKYEVNYKSKCYIIEANDLYTIDERKWIVSINNYYLIKDFSLCKDVLTDVLTKINQFTFNTKDEAVIALTTYLAIEDRVERERVKLASLQNSLELPFLYKGEDTFNLSGDFLSVYDIEAALSKKGCFRINRSNRNQAGVQVSVIYIANMLLLERVIEEIAKENNCTVINIYNHDVPHCNYTKPLYYYWECGNDFIRQFALLKQASS